MRLIPLGVLALAFLTGQAVSAETTTPQAFMRHLYDRFMIHPPKTPPDWARGQASEAFDPALAALIRRYTAAADKAQDAGLGYVPFCGCNDDSGLKYTIAAHPTASDKATAAVTVTSSGPSAGKPSVLTYDLAMTPLGWRVSDIHSKDTPSLKHQVAANLKAEYHLRP